jgi:hypothetical protein
VSDPFFDAARASGTYPPKGWGWKENARQRQLLEQHFAKPNAEISAWMHGEAARLGVVVPAALISDLGVSGS